MESKTNRLSIYLIKEGFDTPDKILKSISPQKEISGIGTFYYASSPTREPDWVKKFFANSLGDTSHLKTAAAKGVLLVQINIDTTTVRFAFCFGTGRHMLKDGVIDERFGLRTTLNTIKPNNIRSIEKNSIGAVSKISKEQMSKGATFSDFGFDIEQDLVRSVTGQSSLDQFGKIITGGDSLSLSVKVNVNNAIEFLKLCYAQYISPKYKEEFGWIDQIQEIKNHKLIENLNAELLRRLNAKELDKLWMSVPDLIDWWDVKGFKYLPRQDKLSDDISITEFLNHYQNFDSVQQIKTKTLTAFSASNDSEIDSWSIYKCIYGEVTQGDKIYVINNGKWYEIASGFVDEINSSYNNIQLSDITLPEYNHKNESEYNESVALGDSSIVCMDRKEIIYGGGHSKIEFCDLLTSDNKIVHVKHYGGSSVLSHLFMQGSVSGELFIQDPKFRKELNKKLPSGRKLINPGNKPDPSSYEIVFTIISNSQDERPHLPFFSKVSIKNAKRRLEGYGYKVTLKKIVSVKRGVEEESET
ncbi:MAG: TIGR04141 family sporadically distributed protein [Bacteroidetes bacterium]|nr:TIGR04141 family sporadically distributed protein [Bacteroidota bacterium]